MESPTPKRQKTCSPVPSSPCSSYGLCELEEPPLLPEPIFYHFKILYDQTWDYEKICAKTFMSEHPYLCVLEHLNKPNTHVHFQGMSRIATATMKARITRLVQGHHLRKFNPKCRPASMSARPVDVTGFQYMAKEYKPAHVLARNMFSDEDLVDLKAKSTLHCTAIKTCVRDYVAGFDKDTIDLAMRVETTDAMINAIGHCLFLGAERGDLDLPEYNKHHTRNSVIRGLLANPHLTVKWKGKLYVL